MTLRCICSAYLLARVRDAVPKQGKETSGISTGFT